MNDSDPGGSSVDNAELLDALYELPLGGHWSEVHRAMCRYWSDLGQASAATQQASLADLERHLERTLRLLKKTPVDHHAWREQLHTIPLPACVLDMRARVVECNAPGEAYADWLQQQATSIRQQLNNREDADKTTLVLLKDGAQQRELFVRPLQEDSAEEHVGGQDERGPNALLLGVLTAAPVPKEGVQLLRERFELTPKEAELCVNLAGGRSLDDLIRLGVGSRNTLRTHLSRSFNKMAVSSQPELVAKVLQTLFTLSQLEASTQHSPQLSAYVDPELHGAPNFNLLQLEDGRQLGFFEYGDIDGYPALLLHGTLDCGLLQREVAAAVRGLGIRLITPERGGVGESDPNPDPSPKAYAGDIGQLLTALGIDDCVVMGRSMGCWDAFTVADDLRDRVSALALISTRLPVRATAQHEAHSTFYRALYQAIWRSDLVGTLMLRMMRMQLLVSGPEKFIEQDGLPAHEVAAVKQENYRRHLRAIWLRSGNAGPAALHEHLKLYRDPIREPPWLHTDIPTLLLHGEDDNNVPLETALAHTETFKNRKVVTFPGVGHRLVHIRLPEILDAVRLYCTDKAAPG